MLLVGNASTREFMYLFDHLFLLGMENVNHSSGFSVQLLNLGHGNTSPGLELSR